MNLPVSVNQFMFGSNRSAEYLLSFTSLSHATMGRGGVVGGRGILVPIPFTKLRFKTVAERSDDCSGAPVTET